MIEEANVETRPKIRPSKAGRWRAGVLILVHALVAVHIAHWMATGSTMTPLEPSEAMEFSKHSVVNAGFIFFVLTILSTLVLGRWFCGWACHLVALQDASRWLLRKVGIRPRPLRSRALAFVPMIAALYMFAYPFVYRLWHGAKVTSVEMAITSTDFWATFPPWPVAILTFVICGFVIVYFLGAKGFCTYGCPYGALYGVADKLAVGRIRVTDACVGSGHCTAVCTSNVLVNAEVRDFGMVVDPGCMKCLDCVSVCPTGALYFGFGRPSLGAPARQEPRKRRPNQTIVEELGLALSFVATFLVIRGLYDAVPFLLALGIAAILAFLFLTASRLLYKENVSLGSQSLRRAGKLTSAGFGYLGLMLLVTGGVVHGGLIKYHSAASATRLTQLSEWRERAIADPSFELPAQQRAVLASAHGHATFVNRFGWLSTARNESEMAFLSLYAGETAAFERYLHAAMERWSADPAWGFDLARFYEARGRELDAIDEYRRFVEIARGAVVYEGLAQLYLRLGRLDEAIKTYRIATAAYPGNPDLSYNLGVALDFGGESGAAIEAFERTLELDPERVTARDNLVGMLCNEGRFREGIEQARLAFALAPGPERLLQMVQAFLVAGDLEGARSELRQQLQADPDNEQLRAMLDSLSN